MIATLKEKGYNIYEVKNTWPNKEAAYKGINVKLISPDGKKMEMQFHTPESLAMKEKTHLLYEKQRVLKKGSSDYKRLNSEMEKLISKMKIPKDIEKVR